MSLPDRSRSSRRCTCRCGRLYWIRTWWVAARRGPADLHLRRGAHTGSAARTWGSAWGPDPGWRWRTAPRGRACASGRRRAGAAAGPGCAPRPRQDAPRSCSTASAAAESPACGSVTPAVIGWWACRTSWAGGGGVCRRTQCSGCTMWVASPECRLRAGTAGWGPEPAPPKARPPITASSGQRSASPPRPRQPEGYDLSRSGSMTRSYFLTLS